MHDAGAVGVGQRLRALAGDADRVGHAQPLLAAEPLAQRLAPDVRHGVPELAVGLARVVDRADVRVLQAGGRRDLAAEALGVDRERDVAAEQLEGDRTVVPEVEREVHRGHAAAAQLALELVASAEGEA